MTTDLHDLRTGIPYDRDFPYVVVDAKTDRLRARFADEHQAIGWAADHNGLVADTTPSLPPTEPGWYSSGRYPIDKAFAGYHPYHLDEVGDWYEQGDEGTRKMLPSEVAAVMPLQKIGVVR